MMDAACNSPVPSSQEGEHDPIQQESCNPPINVESTPTPQDVETGQTLETTAQTEAQMQAEIDLVKKDKRKSIVWKHFTLIKVNEQDKAQCNYCKKLLGGSSRNGTKHLHTHMDTCVKKMLMERSNNSKGQTCLMPKVIQGKQELGAGTYNAENARKELAQAIIMHDYPLSIVDHVGFKRYSAALQPLFQVPSRNTIKKEIFKVYEYERSTTMKLLDSLQGRVAITSDMWTSSNQKRGYMAVTAHYIDGSWTLQSHVLRFIYVPAPHTSDRLSNALVECLMDWNIDTKLSTIKMDLVEYYYEKMHGQDSSIAEIQKIKDLCYDLISDYQSQMNQGSNNDSSMLAASGDDALDDFDAYMERKKRAKTSSVKTELDHYLEEDVIPRKSSDFDILMWWKLNGVKYPTLQAIAKDVLAIPVSTVASESSFSTSGIILSPHRSRLHWTTLEALMCARSWLWSVEKTGELASSVITHFEE